MVHLHQPIIMTLTQRFGMTLIYIKAEYLIHITIHSTATAITGRDGASHLVLVTGHGVGTDGDIGATTIGDLHTIQDIHGVVITIHGTPILFGALRADIIIPLS